MNGSVLSRTALWMSSNQIPTGREAKGALIFFVRLLFILIALGCTQTLASRCAALSKVRVWSWCRTSRSLPQYEGVPEFMVQWNQISPNTFRLLVLDIGQEAIARENKLRKSLCVSWWG